MKEDVRNGTTPSDAKTYLSKRQVPQLFESLMTGLMYNQPDDHIHFLLECLYKVKEEGQQGIAWNSFVDMKKRMSLPPIGRDEPKTGRTSSAANVKRGPSATKDKAKQADASTNGLSKELSKLSPLPPIGSASYIPKCPIILLIGAPGSGRHSQGRMLIGRYAQNNWVLLSMGDILKQAVMGEGRLTKENILDIEKLMNGGEWVDEELALKLLIDQLAAKPNAAGIIIEGFPRSLKQLELYNKVIGRIDRAILLDCAEEPCIQHLTMAGYTQGRIASSVAHFKEATLPMAYSLEKMGKLTTLNADRDKVILFHDISAVIDSTVKATGSAGAIKNLTEVDIDNSLLSIPTLDVHVADEGRRPNLPQCPIILVFGGPGSGRSSHCQRLAERYEGWVHVSAGGLLRDVVAARARGDPKWGTVGSEIGQGKTVSDESVRQLVLADLASNQDAKGVILEGYPRNQQQLEDFYRYIGGTSMSILLDCDEHNLQKRLQGQAQTKASQDAIAARLNTYKTHTLAVIKYLDIQGQLVLIQADKDVNEVYYQLCHLFDYAFHATVHSGPLPVIEDVIESKVAVKTGEGDHTIPEGTGQEATAQAMSQDTTALSSKPVIFVVGGPGCGKGTQCAHIVEKYGFCHLSSGDLLRAEVNSGSERGKELNQIMESGALVSLDVVLTLLKEAMTKNTDAKGFLIDGYPRELEQGTRFEQEIVLPKTVLYFEVSDEVMTDRLLGRAQTSGRVDDNIDTIKKRLLTFHQHSDAVLAHYEANSLLRRIPATGSVESIFQEVVKIIDGL